MLLKVNTKVIIPFPLRGKVFALRNCSVKNNYLLDSQNIVISVIKISCNSKLCIRK